VRVRAGADGSVLVTFTEPRRRVAPGQTVVLYRGDIVAAGGVVAAGRAVQH
jgi:tRNA U34 2-thiouridine synthase MnmA/TrmU